MRHSFGSPPILAPCIVEGPTGNGEPKLVFDTGASVTVVNTDLLRMLGYIPEESKEFCFLTTASGIVKAPIIRLTSLTAFGIKRPNFPVAAHALPVQSNVLGLLGTDFLAELVVVINFKSSWIEVR